jgi:glutamate racemase
MNNQYQKLHKTLMEKKIGIFDSGVGGLSALDSIYSKNKNTSYVYIADQLHIPYGNKSAKEIINFTNVITETLQNKYNVDSIISACHTSSVIAVPNLKKSIKITGINDALNACLKSISFKNVNGLILTTPATHRHDFYNNNYFTKNEIKGSWKTVPCPNFVPLVESKDFSKLSIEVKTAKIKMALQKYIYADITHIVLGCTHYPFLKESISKIFGRNIIILDPADFIYDKFSKSTKPQIQLITTGSLNDFKNSTFELFKVKPEWLLNAKFSKINWHEMISSVKQASFY